MNTSLIRATCLSLTLTTALMSSNMTSALGQTVSHEEMERIYSEVRTPYKFGMVLAPQSNDRKYDCPTVFREGDKWYMTYVCYNGSGGNDGRGYETWLATSKNLLEWETLGRILPFATDTSLWDANQRGGFPALLDYTWGGSYAMGRYKGRHYISYIGGHGTGYEAVREPLSIGLASTEGDITTAHSWECMDRPVMSYNDKDAQWWEKLTQYKSTIYRIDSKLFGYPFVMFYNAGGKDDTHPKGERIGIALSKDMKRWERYGQNPVFAHDSDGTITGDAQLVRMGDTWVMFYFSAFNPKREYNAFNTFAASKDLVHWTDWDGDDLIVPSEPYDEMFAHKSFVVKWGDTVYHFYCAVNNSGQRGIALATSRHKGKSEHTFPTPSPTGHRVTISLNSDWEVTSHGKSFKADLPINLDDYYGAVQKMHGNLHGEAVFRKTFIAPASESREAFLRFEGVGTYATVILNGIELGTYDIGRVVETIDVSKAIRLGEQNELVVRVSHPEGITDMPWVCGGCSSEWGFSEGSQPFGIFRPVSLELTDKVRIEPFGVHVWSNASTDSIFFETEVKNYGDTPETFSLINKLCLKDGKQVVRLTTEATLEPGETKSFRQAEAVSNAILWSLEKPYMYNVNTLIKRKGKATDSESTPFGFRTISWPLTRKDGDKRFLLNGKPVMINGVCEYEHILGQSHAFSAEQVAARIKQVRLAGFNAFRDAHQPHNLLYGQLIEQQGLLWWPQFSAHIWYDTPQFRKSFIRHLRQWVKQHRNSPALILWGLQNESTLPKDFAEECTRLIREMDPTCGSQRLVTTCNGGEGTDWNVVQNWSGTYGGDIDNYGNELKREDQLLNGEYGAWRTLGNHSEGYTEEKFCATLEKKIHLAQSVRDSVCGQFLWLLHSHDNPGRRQPEEGFRRIDKVGPFNHKGLYTIWDQPTDGLYMYKENYVSSSQEPFVYQTAKGKVYTNCDTTYTERHDHYTVLKGLVDGSVVTTDTIATDEYAAYDESFLRPAKDLDYVFRLNCGGDYYTDKHGSVWAADDSTVSHSWGSDFGVSPYMASQTYAANLAVSPLMRTARFGRHRLSFDIDVPQGDYLVELYFIEPWHGRGSTSEKADYEGLRLFDVAINNEVVIKDLDLWAQAHYGKPYKRSIWVHSGNGGLHISFPKVKAGQAIISAIAVARKHDPNATIKPQLSFANYSKGFWKTMEYDTMASTPDSLLPPRTTTGLKVNGKMKGDKMEWQFDIGVAKVYAIRWKYYNPDSPKKLLVTLRDQNGVVYVSDLVSFLQTQQKKTKRKMTSITTGSFVNAGHYTITLSGDGLKGMLFDEMTVE